MSLDLAHDLRRFVDGGAAPITVEEIARRSPERRRGPSVRAALLAAAVVLVVAVVVGLVATDPFDSGSVEPAKTTRIPLVDVPDGVSVQRLGHRDVFVVREGSRVTVFDTNVHHLAGERGLWWCPNEQFFASPTHAELFDRDGKAIGGPARSGLDRYRASIRGSSLVIDTGARIAGTPGNAHSRDSEDGGVVGPWDSGPGSFCSGALKANSVDAIVDVQALPTLTFDQVMYQASAGRVAIFLSGAPGVTLGFDDPRFRACKLSTDAAVPASCVVELPPGSYTVYDTVPSHRAAGLEATIVVNATECPTGQVPSPVLSGPRCVAAKGSA